MVRGPEEGWRPARASCSQAEGSVCKGGGGLGLGLGGCHGERQLALRRGGGSTQGPSRWLPLQKQAGDGIRLPSPAQSQAVGRCCQQKHPRSPTSPARPCTAEDSPRCSSSCSESQHRDCTCSLDAGAPCPEPACVPATMCPAWRRARNAFAISLHIFSCPATPRAPHCPAKSVVLPSISMLASHRSAGPLAPSASSWDPI